MTPTPRLKRLTRNRGQSGFSCGLFNADGKVVAFAAWAYLSEAVEKRLQEAEPRLAPADWKSGDRLWLINLFAPFGHTNAALAELRETALAGKSFNMHKRNADGTRTILQLTGSLKSDDHA